MLQHNKARDSAFLGDARKMLALLYRKVWIDPGGEAARDRGQDCQGNLEMKGCARPWLAHHPDLSIVHLDKSFADRQAKTCAAIPAADA